MTTGQGRIVSSTGSWVHVETPSGERVACRLRGRFRVEDQVSTNPLAVGDVVSFTLSADGTGAIERIEPRRNALTRRAAGRKVGIESVLAANIDRAWIVQSVDMPKLNPGLVDRFLVSSLRDGIAPGVVINKIDLAGDDLLAQDLAWFLDIYQPLGYPIVCLSTQTGEGLDAFRDLLAHHVSVVAGQSGVGKTSLLNALTPGLGLRVGEVSSHTRKGMHTTTHASLQPLPSGGYMVDTPGIREFGVMGLEPHDLGHYFVDFEPYLPNCRFATCTHDHEPGCAVKDAVDEERIAHSRYLSYLSMLKGLLDTERDVGR